MNVYLKVIILFLGLCLSSSAFTQEKGFPIRFLIGNEATAILFQDVLTAPIHPSFQLGTEIRYNTNETYYLYQTFNIGYMYHKHLFQGGYINSEFGFDYKLGFGLNLKSLVGLGYLHTFSTEEEYKFIGGEYIGKKDKGNSRLMPSLSVGVGFRIFRKKSSSPEIMILYRSWLEYPYSPGFISLMSHTNLCVGIKFFIN